MINSMYGAPTSAATRTRTVAAALAGVAGVATVVGGFLPLDTSTDGEHYTTAWTAAAGVPLYGIPLTVAALVLVGASVLLLRGTRRPALAAVTAGAGLLAGLVAAIRLAASAAAHNAELLRARFPDLQVLDTAGIGAWVLVLAAVLAVVGAVLAPWAFGPLDGPPGGSRPLAALAGSVAAALAGVSSFLAVTVTTVAGDPPSVAYNTGWVFAVESGPPGDAGQVAPLTGIPLVITAAALLVGALVALDMRGAERAAPLLTGAAGTLVGVFVAIWIAWLALADAQSTADIGITTTLGAGAWVLLGATLVAVAVSVVLWVRRVAR
jgi:drug/metabolite transporter (DMT)-like permease